ncbi:MAG: queuosine precursor transporter [Planctomycetota bacterium]|nr:queuosine precursor transporter [Planctomycetota bacterium]
MSTSQEHPNLRRERAELTYAFCAALFVVVLVLTNVIGTKLFLLFQAGGPFLFGGEPWILTSGILTYPITFLLTDLVSEIWGRKRANMMVIWGFGMSLLMLGILQVAVALPPAGIWAQPGLGFPDGAAMQGALEATFASPAILLGASMTAYLVAQLFDVHLYHFWWKVTGGKHMWLRNNGSTCISQLVDTIIVNGIFLRFGLKMEWGAIGEVIVAVYLCKVVLALIDTPLIYLGRHQLERFLGIEHDPERRHAPLA